MSSFRPNCLEGKVALVTGGGSGICKGITRVFMQHGCEAIIVSRKLDVLQQAAQELQQQTGRRCLPLAGDVRDEKSIGQVVDRALKEFGHIDILINGAAGNFLCPMEKLSYGGFKTVMEIDAHGTFIVSSVVFKKALKQSGGIIINISATLHQNGTLLQAHAGAAKAAVDALTKHMACEWGPYGVRCIGVAPGPIAGTVGMEKLNPFKEGKAETSGLASYVPLQRLGTVEDIGYMCLFLVLHEASYVTGVTITVDGGQALTVPNFPVIEPAFKSQWASGAQSKL